jgi:hypothetical protein
MTVKDQSAHEDFIKDTINGAEEIRDPLEDLVDRTITDPGAPFEPEVLQALSELKARDPAAFERLRAELKRAGARVTALDKAIAGGDGGGGGGGGGGGLKQADCLIELAQSADLFHDPDGNAYADLEIDGHWETWAIRSKGFKKWLRHRYYEECGGGVNSEALLSALGAIEAKAHFEGPERAVNIRVGVQDDKIYLDLCDDAWRCVEIGADGWRVIDRPPIRFRRTSGMRPLRVPERGGSIEQLRKFLNVRSQADFVLAVAWLLAALRGKGPYPVLGLAGEQGTAKSTFCAILRALIDPNVASLRALPREDRDLFIAANNGHVLAFDNVSRLPPWLSDTLCRLATGGGFATRQLYTDDDEVLFNAKRPIILNGIEDFVTRPDLADRAIVLTLEPIPEERKRSEEELWGDFEFERARMLGVLLDALAHGLRRLPETRLTRSPRMADFARWATACEAAFWPAGAFQASYEENIGATVENVLEGDPVASAVRAFMSQRTEWQGTASELLPLLEAKATPQNN